MSRLPIRLTANGPVTPDEAWERYAVPARWPSWAPHLRAVDCADERLRKASSGTVTAVGGLTVRFRVDELDEAARTWAWTVRRGPLHATLRHGVEAVGAGTRTWLELDGPPWLWPPLVGYLPLARWSLGRLVSR